MYHVVTKLKMVKQRLKEVNASQFSNISGRTRSARDKLFAIQGSLGSYPGDVELRRQEKEALSELVRFSKAEESFLKQKSRVN